jgi:hypothetical protein
MILKSTEPFPGSPRFVLDESRTNQLLHTTHPPQTIRRLTQNNRLRRQIESIAGRNEKLRHRILLARRERKNWSRRNTAHIQPQVTRSSRNSHRHTTRISGRCEFNNSHPYRRITMLGNHLSQRKDGENRSNGQKSHEKTRSNTTQTINGSPVKKDLGQSQSVCAPLVRTHTRQ